MACAVILLAVLILASLVITEKSHVAKMSVENGSLSGDESLLMVLQKGKIRKFGALVPGAEIAKLAKT